MQLRILNEEGIFNLYLKKPRSWLIPRLSVFFAYIKSGIDA